MPVTELSADITIPENAKGNLEAVETWSTYLVGDGDWDARRAFELSLNEKGIRHYGIVALLTAEEIAALPGFKPEYTKQIKDTLKSCYLRLSSTPVNWQQLRDEDGVIEDSKVIFLYQLDVYHPHLNAQYKIPERFKNNPAVLMPLREIMWSADTAMQARILRGFGDNEFAGELLFSGWYLHGNKRYAGNGWGSTTENCVRRKLNELGLDSKAISHEGERFLYLNSDDRRRMLGDLFNVNPDAEPIPNTVAKPNREWLTGAWVGAHLPERMQGVFSEDTLEMLAQKAALRKIAPRFASELAKAVVGDLLSTEASNDELLDQPEWVDGAWVAQNLPSHVRSRLSGEFFNRAVWNAKVIKVAKDIEAAMIPAIEKAAVQELRALSKSSSRKPESPSEPAQG